MKFISMHSFHFCSVPQHVLHNEIIVLLLVKQHFTVPISTFSSCFWSSGLCCFKPLSVTAAPAKPEWIYQLQPKYSSVQV